MVEEGPVRWKGTRVPNTSFAWTIIAVGTGLTAVALYQAFFLDVDVNLWFLAMLVLGLVAYAGISLTSVIEMEVELVDDEIVYTKRERTLGFMVRDRSIGVDRDRIVKVVERNAGLGLRVVRLEGENGRRLLTFPEFLEPKEHDAMMARIIEWGNQPEPESSSSSPEDKPPADSR
ncbi:MAG: hypothetical protein JSW25_03020 [Thermoplasmata archaeon]|nr:MAG: hypothetical protein JSW25_03020 [Thermoplasmata archaeon]